MGSPSAPRAALLILILAAPLLLPVVVPLHLLPPGLAYAVTGGRWLVLLGLIAAAVSLSAGERLSGLWPAVGSRLDRLAPRGFAIGTWALFLAVVLILIPGHRWSAATVSGDEPKYLQMAESLCRDLDVDIGAEGEGPLTPARFAANLGALGRSMAAALASAFSGDEVPEGHKWGLGNWTVAGRHGGRYYVQSPGLPALLAPGLALQRALAPGRADPLLPLLTLALLWSLAAVGTTLLAAAVCGSRLAGLLAGSAVALSPPLLVGGYHFYPEAAAAAAVPWLARHARSAAPTPGIARSAALALTAGALPWLHPKFLLLALVTEALLLRRVRRERAKLVCTLISFALPLLGLLLFDHHVTGLFRPDALYQRFGDELYTGPASLLSPMLLTGLVNALLGARDGLLVMAPVLIAAVLVLPRWWRRDRRTALELGALFASLWLAAAAHQGGAPGPPGRLMAPVAGLLAAPLALGLVDLRFHLPFRWAAAGLAVVTAAITLTMLGDWRRAVNPYRGFTAETHFGRDLPDGPREPGQVSSAVKRAWDLGRGAILAGILAFWAWIFGRAREEPPHPDRWRQLRDLHLGLWATVGGASWLLHALGP